MTTPLLRSLLRLCRLSFSAERVFLLLTVILSACPALRAFEDQRNPSIVRFRCVKGFAAIVPVSINGSRPYEFLLDTGASYTSVDTELARELALEGQGEASITTLVRRIPVSFAHVRSVKIGPISAVDVEVLVRDLNGLRSLDPRIRGVLGQNAIDHADYLIDYKQRAVQFDAGGDLFGSLHGKRIPLIRIPVTGDARHGNMAVHMRLDDGISRKTRLLIDSGSASLVLFSNEGDIRRKRPELPTPHNTVQDAAGQKKLAELRNVQLGAGEARWNVVADVVDFGDIADDVRGLLPTSMFTRIYISNSGGFVVFNPKVDRRYRLPSEPDRTGGASGGR